MVDIQQLSFKYRKDKVLDDLSVIFSHGKVTSILGRNGSGKSTLMKNINGILKPSSGTVYINGKDVSVMSLNETASEIGFLSQRSEGIDATVMDAVLTGRKPHIKFGISDSDIYTTKRILNLLGLENIACRKTTEISGGELQKVVIARALVQEPKVLLLDEPVNHLDMVNQLEVLGQIRDITIDNELTTIIVMHDLNTALRFSDELIFIKDGMICGKCGKDDLTPEIVNEAYGMDVEIINRQGNTIIIPK